MRVMVTYFILKGNLFRTCFGFSGIEIFLIFLEKSVDIWQNRCYDNKCAESAEVSELADEQD